MVEAPNFAPKMEVQKPSVADRVRHAIGDFADRQIRPVSHEAIHQIHDIQAQLEGTPLSEMLDGYDAAIRKSLAPVDRKTAIHGGIRRFIMGSATATFANYTIDSWTGTGGHERIGHSLIDSMLGAMCTLYTGSSTLMEAGWSERRKLREKGDNYRLFYDSPEGLKNAYGDGMPLASQRNQILKNLSLGKMQTETKNPFENKK